MITYYSHWRQLLLYYMTLLAWSFNGMCATFQSIDTSIIPTMCLRFEFNKIIWRESLLKSYFPFELIQKILEEVYHTLISCSKNLTWYQGVYYRIVLKIGGIPLGIFLFWETTLFYVFRKSVCWGYKELHEPDLWIVLILRLS